MGLAHSGQWPAPSDWGYRWRGGVSWLTHFPNGEVGFHMPRERLDCCLQAAIATVLQVSIDEVPDAQLSERIAAGEDPEAIARDACEQLERWARGRGLRILVHRKFPVPRRRWIG